jgi:hypothetical protein
MPLRSSYGGDGDGVETVRVSVMVVMMVVMMFVKMVMMFSGFI